MSHGHNISENGNQDHQFFSIFYLFLPILVGYILFPHYTFVPAAEL